MTDSGGDPTELDLSEASRALSRARAEARPSAISKALLRLGQIHSTRLEAEPALAAFQEVRALGLRMGDRYDVAAADDLTGLLLCHLDQPERALEIHRRAADVFAELHATADESLARSFAAWALLELGRAEEALVESLASESLDPGSGLEGTVAIALAELGRLEDARGYVPRQPELSDDFFPWFTRVEAHLVARQGHHAESRELFGQALQLLEVRGDRAEYRCCLRQMTRLGLAVDGPVSKDSG